MSKYVRIGKMPVADGKMEEFLAIMHSVKPEEINNCLQYDISHDDTYVVVHEVWESADDHKASLQNPRVQALIAQAMPLIAGTPALFFEGER